MAEKLKTNQKQITSPIAMSVWYTKHWEINQSSDILQNESYNQRQCGRLSRFEAETKTKWNNYLNNTKIADRVTELSRWHSLIDKYYNRIKNEISSVQIEKTEMEHDLDKIFIPLQVVNQCINVRETRRPTELTNDDVGKELKNELQIIEETKKALTEKIQMACEKLNSLDNVKRMLELDLSNKNTAIEIDSKNFILNENSTSINRMTNALHTPKLTISYKSWQEHCNNIKQLYEEELDSILNYKDSLKIIRYRVKNDIKHQQGITNFVLRKRIYQTRKVKTELEWQHSKIQKEKFNLSREISYLERKIIDLGGYFGCVETRLENRKSRPEFEMCRDDVEEGLKDELLQLQETKNILTSKYNCAKATYKDLEAILNQLEKDIDSKSHTLTTDIMCLETRCELTDEEIANESCENSI